MAERSWRLLRARICTAPDGHRSPRRLGVRPADELVDQPGPGVPHAQRASPSPARCRPGHCECVNHLGKRAFRWLYRNVLLPGRPMPLPAHMSMVGKNADRSHVQQEA
jgi:hypothetical protein